MARFKNSAASVIINNLTVGTSATDIILNALAITSANRDVHWLDRSAPSRMQHEARFMRVFKDKQPCASRGSHRNGTGDTHCASGQLGAAS